MVLITQNNNSDDGPKDERVWMYRKGESKLFQSPADVPDGEGWQDTPVPDDVLEPSARNKEPEASEEDPVNGELEELREAANEMGIELDKRWGVKRLKTEIDKVVSELEDTGEIDDDGSQSD